MEIEEFKTEFFKLVKEALKYPAIPVTCELCPLYTQGRVIEFLMLMFTDAVNRIDVSAQVMEDYISVFKEIEESLFREKMRGPD